MTQPLFLIFGGVDDSAPFHVFYRIKVRITGMSPAAVTMMSLFFSLKLLLYMTYPMIIRAKERKDSEEGPLS